MPPHAMHPIQDTDEPVCWDANDSSPELEAAHEIKEGIDFSQPRIERSVTFNDDIAVCEIDARSAFSEAEASCIWYSDGDYDRIKKDFQATLKKASNGESITEESGCCLRGLEGKTKFGSRRKKNSKAAALDSVWTTQINLWKKKMENEGAIAAAYRPHSLHSKYRAIELAHSDAQYVNEHVRDEYDI